MHDPSDPVGRRLTDEFGVSYVLKELTRKVDDVGSTMNAMATKAEVAFLSARVDDMVKRPELTERWRNDEAHRQTTDAKLDKIDARLTTIERNQLPPWFLSLLGIVVAFIVAVVSHYWK
jgi:hypothetical protein